MSPNDIETTVADDRVSVVVVAAQPVVRVGVRHLLDAQDGIRVVGDAQSTADAVALLTALKPNVVVLDPDSDDPGLHSIAALAATGHSTILIFTAVSERATHSEAVALGAMGVVQKHQSAHALRRAIDRVHAGEVWLDRQTTATLLRGLRKGSASDPEDAKIRSLTKRELEVIALIGIGLKNDAIAMRLSISQATVRNHLTSILGKLDLSDRFELAFYAAGHGLVDEQDRMPGLRAPQSPSGQLATGIRTIGGRIHRLPADVAADFGVRRRLKR